METSSLPSNPFASSLDGGPPTMPAAAPRRKSQSQSTLHRPGAERDEVESPDDTWSGQESGNDATDQRDGQSGGGLKRKRPITVSYVALPIGIEQTHVCAYQVAVFVSY